MKIIIAGAGEVGVHLAQMLTHEEQNIVLMDTDAKRLDEVKGSIEALVSQAIPYSLKTKRLLTYRELIYLLLLHQTNQPT